MKRLAIVVAVFAVLLVATPWGIGKVAQSRVNASLDQLAEAVPYLSIVERKYTPGWFRSEQEVTFAATGPSFTVRNEILHGPVLWFSGFGIARVNSRVVLAEGLRRRMIDAIGTDEPLRVSTRIGFFGGRTTTLTSEKRTVTLKHGATELSWDDLEVRASYSSDLDSIEIDGKWPRVALRSLTGGPEGGEIDDISMDGTSERIAGDLYDTEFSLSFEKATLVDAAGKSLEIDDGRYEVGTTVDGDFVSIGIKAGSGAAKGRDLEMFGGDVQAVHYDFTFRRLHTNTLAKLVTAIKDSYVKPPTPGVNAENAAIGPIKAQVMELFRHDPEFAIDRIGLSTKDGDAYLKGVLRCRGVTQQDLEVGGLGLLAKLEADLSFEAPLALINKIDGGPAWMSQMVEEGLLARQGEKLVSHLEYAAGKLQVNGKVQPIPGLGGPPPPEPMGPE
jgi:uncharacterized protein YdgA (DUF945 family)